MKVLLKFRHGLGDAAQFVSVLQHLQRYRPGWTVDVVALTGKGSLFRGLINALVPAKDDAEANRLFDAAEGYTEKYDIHWPECWHAIADAPSTKTTLCLRHIFTIEPDSTLYDGHRQLVYPAYPLITGELVTHFLADNPRAVAIHYQANTSAEKKDLEHDTIRDLCRDLLAAGYSPIILDWDRRSPLPGELGIGCPDADHPMWLGTGTGDGRTLACLLAGCELVIGVDSGPLHVAALLDVPIIGVWREHFPGQFIEPTDNVLHLVPDDWRTKGVADQPDAANYFETHYRHRTYRALSNALGPVVMEALDAMDGKHDTHVKSCGHWVRRDNYEQDMTIVRDVYANDCYRLELIRGVVEQARVIVDVGACIGAFAMRAHEINPNATIICVEACPENIETLKRNVGDFAEVVEGACTYEPGELMLLNAVRPNCESTGGSIVIPLAAESTGDTQPWWNAGYQYGRDMRAITKWTLEELAGLGGRDGQAIDLLKLDCEGSEYSILAGCDLGRVGFIVGEYHDPTRWFPFRDEHFADWDYGAMYDGKNGGLFHLRKNQ